MPTLHRRAHARFIDLCLSTSYAVPLLIWKSLDHKVCGFLLLEEALAIGVSQEATNLFRFLCVSPLLSAAREHSTLVGLVLEA
jgi:hypothetical protein